ncbi:tetratricopeptide repeat protein [Actinoplanes sp. URMC 104]|uniref:tetratricopeptide repeat protein n=1 Tax=Actinoplanes sp. URMC 104 TaxID=3423409 RepID=UPI003F1D34E0
MTRWWAPRRATGQIVTGSVVFGDVVQVTGVDGDVTVSLDRPPYQVVQADGKAVPVSVEEARAQPSRLLLARHQIVPFTPRDRTGGALDAWVAGAEPVAALLVHGAGGEGKTRLATAVGAQCAAAKWAVWHVKHAATAATSRVELPGGKVLAVVDYADRWPSSALLALLTQLRVLHVRAGTRVRVLMLARSAGSWWPALADRADSDLGIRVDRWPLPELAADSTDTRHTLFNAAAEGFAAALGLAPAAWPVPDLAGDGFRPILAVHMAALAGVDAIGRGQTPPIQPGAVSAYLLRREQTYWRELYARAETPIQTSPEKMHRIVIAATLTGSQPRSVAHQALASAGFADTITASDQIIDDHITCYPPVDPRTVFEPLHPDRFSEDLIAMSTPGHGGDGVNDLERDWVTEAISALLTVSEGKPPAWTANVVTVLVETALRWPHFANEALFPVLRQQPELALAAGGATLSRLASIRHVDSAAAESAEESAQAHYRLVDVLEAVYDVLPSTQHVDFDLAAADIASVIFEERMRSSQEPGVRASVHELYARRLYQAGRFSQAVGIYEQAVRLRRELARDGSRVELGRLGSVLSDLGGCRRNLGQITEGLAAAKEGHALLLSLNAVEPETYAARLAHSLNMLGTCFGDFGDRRNAFDCFVKSSQIYTQLAKSERQFDMELAISLHNLSTHLRNFGDLEQALSVAKRSEAVWSALTRSAPSQYRHGLASALNAMGNIYTAMNDYDQAVQCVSAATSHYRVLAEKNEDFYLPRLAETLDNQVSPLLRLGRYREALERVEEGLKFRRELVASNAAVYLPDLALSLNNKAAVVAESGNLAEAEKVCSEAIGMYRRLVDRNPKAHSEDLAQSLHNLGTVRYLRHRAGSGSLDEALFSVEEAVEIRQRLAEAGILEDWDKLAESEQLIDGIRRQMPR